MKECPYCKKEMEIGYIHKDTEPVQWIPKGKKPSLFRCCAAHDGIELTGEYTLLGGYKAEAYYCCKCGVVLLSTN